MDIAKPGQFYFAFIAQIQPALSQLFGELLAEGLLAALSPAVFASRAAHYFGELNAIHPFREGNGRTQREFLRELAAASGHPLR